jgi:hypothetical protein
MGFRISWNGIDSAMELDVVRRGATLVTQGTMYQAGAPARTVPLDARIRRVTWPKDRLVARLRTSLLFCRDAFARLDDAKLTDAVPAGPPGSDQTSPRVRSLLYFVTDLAEHYSQIASYMRLMGMIPPSALPRPNR